MQCPEENTFLRWDLCPYCDPMLRPRQVVFPTRKQWGLLPCELQKLIISQLDEFFSSAVRAEVNKLVSCWIRKN